MASLVLGISYVTGAANTDGARVPRVTINLDLPPEERWTEVTKSYETAITKLFKLLKSSVSKDVKDAIFAISRDVEKYVPYPYNEEIKGIARNLRNCTIEEVLLGNIFYELVAYKERNKTRPVEYGVGCTSIVAEAVNKTIVHGRNLDYPFVNTLRNVTIMVDFQRFGKIAYTGTVFAGLVGILTGQRPYKYTISLNERHQGTFWENIADALTDGLKSTISFHIRDALDQDNFDFHDAVRFMADKSLIAPCYVTMGGVKSGEGVVITRDRTIFVNKWKLDASKGTWYVLETNYDRWTTPPPSDDRRDPATKGMEEMTRANVSAHGLYKVLSIHPVFNNKTTYTTIMSASHPELYGTWIRYYSP